MRRIQYALLVAAVCGCGSEPQITQPIEALASARLELAPQYHVVTLASLGGTASQGNSIDNRGRVAGFSNIAGDASTHATLWDGGSTIDLGTLGGPNSNVAWPGQNNGGVIVGIAETADADPLGESWSCSFFFPTSTGHSCLGFVWEDGVMTPLPTLGGNNDFATGVNSRDQVVGWAETVVHDPTCKAPQILQFRAVMWEPETGAMHELPPFPGDSTSAATAINEKGQVVGVSSGAGGNRAFLWPNGSMKDLNTLVDPALLTTW